MRLISTCFFLLFSTVCFSQIYDLIRTAEYNNSEYTTAKKKFEFCGMTRNFNPLIDISKFQNSTIKKDTNPDSQKQIIRIHCFTTINKNESPLIVIDGVPFEMANLKSLNPKDIENITILKNATASAIFSCRPSNYNGVILITTKQSKLQQFIIKDFLDGNPIPAATVSFVSMDKKDTVMMAANDSGIAITDKIKSASGEVRISAVGYETVSQPFSNSSLKKVHEIKLSRNIKACQLVIINTISEYRRISCGFSVRYVKSTQENENQQPKSIMKLYPNPVSRGSAIKIQFELAESENINIRIINLTGTILSSQNFLASESLNSLSISTDSRWAAGIYLLQVYAKGKLLASDKIIIQ